MEFSVSFHFTQNRAHACEKDQSCHGVVSSNLVRTLDAASQPIPGALLKPHQRRFQIGQCQRIFTAGIFAPCRLVERAVFVAPVLKPAHPIDHDSHKGLVAPAVKPRFHDGAVLKMDAGAKPRAFRASIHEIQQVDMIGAAGSRSVDRRNIDGIVQAIEFMVGDFAQCFFHAHDNSGLTRAVNTKYAVFMSTMTERQIVAAVHRRLTCDAKRRADSNIAGKKKRLLLELSAGVRRASKTCVHDRFGL